MKQTVLLLLSFAVGCEATRGRVEIDLGPVDRDRVADIEIVVTRNGCIPDEEIVSRGSVAAGEPLDLDLLEDGEYGFWIRVRSDVAECDFLATECEEVTLPISNGVLSVMLTDPGVSSERVDPCALPFECECTDLRGPSGRCPPGWATHIDRRLIACDPLPDDAPCDADEEIRFPGDATTCTPLFECPAPGSDWAPGALYVRDGAVDGVGSRARPFGTIAEALVAATEGTTIALDEGSYVGPVTLPDGVVLRGACPSQTVLSAGGGAAIIVDGTRATVRALHVTGSRTGIVARRGAHLTLDGVLVDGVAETGVDVDGSILHADLLAVRDAPMFGVSVLASVDATLTNVEIAGGGEGVLFVGEGARVTVEDSVLRGRTSPIVVSNQAGAELALARTLVTGVTERGIVASSGSVTLTDVAIVGTRSADPEFFALRAQRGAQVEGERVWIRVPRGAAISARDSGTAVSLSRVAAEAVGENEAQCSIDPSGGEWNGVVISNGALLTSDEVLVRGFSRCAIELRDPAEPLQCTPPFTHTSPQLRAASLLLAENAWGICSSCLDGDPDVVLDRCANVDARCPTPDALCPP